MNDILDIFRWVISDNCVHSIFWILWKWSFLQTLIETCHCELRLWWLQFPLWKRDSCRCWFWHWKNLLFFRFKWLFQFAHFMWIWQWWNDDFSKFLFKLFIIPFQFVFKVDMFKLCFWWIKCIWILFCFVLVVEPLSNNETEAQKILKTHSYFNKASGSAGVGGREMSVYALGTNYSGWYIRA